MNKPRLCLIPKKALWTLGKGFTHGEVKYGTHNWRKGIGLLFLLDAAVRHIYEFADGEDFDKPSGNHHLGNAMADLCMAVELFYDNPEADDRYASKNKKVTSRRRNSKVR